MDRPRNPIGDDRLRRARWTTGTVVALFVLGAGVRIVAIAHTTQTAVGNMPLPDDAFYYFVLARNAAAGQWPVVSADGVSTTGFQPMWGALLSALDAIPGELSATGRISIAQALGGLIGLATGWAIYRLGRKLSPDPAPAILACAAYLLSPQIIKHNLNGMETSLAILGLLVLALVFLFIDPSDTTPVRAFLLGAACGACLLARVDLVFFLGAGIAAWTFNLFRRKVGDSRRRGFARLGVFLIGAVAALLPWVWATAIAGSGPLPESGRAIRNLTLLLNDLPLLAFVASLREAPQIFLRTYGEYAVQFTSAWVRQVPVLLPVTIPLFAALELRTAERASLVLAIVAFMLVASAARRERPRLTLALGLWGVYAVAMTIAYAAVILGPWFFQRYAAPIGMFFNLLLLVGIWRLIRGTRLVPAALPLAAAGIALGFLALVWQGSYRWIVVGEQAVPDDGFYRAAEYIDGQLPAQARIGVFSAGLITYSVRQPVVALDGKVNRQARQAMEDGRMFAYVCEAGIEYIADWDKMIRHLLVQRSQGWLNDNLRPVAVIEVEGGNDILIQQVDRARCPAGAVP
jgi:hypothetical protein